jgi:drug/metabolite transporter (DMT)-like permease
VKHRAEIFLITAAFGFAAGGVAAKVLREADLDAFRLTQIRITSAALILLIIALIKGKKQLYAKRSEIKDLVLSVALIIEFTAPIWIALYLRFVKKKNISRTAWIGIICAFLGLVLISQIWSGKSLHPLGVIVAILDALALAYYFLTADRLGQNRSSLSLTTWGMGIASIFWAIALPWWNFPFEFLTQSFSLSGELSGYSAPGWVLILWIVVTATVIPYLLTVAAIRELSASTSSVIAMLEPIIAGVIAWWLLNEAFTNIQLIGCAAVLVGVYLADKARRGVSNA